MRGGWNLKHDCGATGCLLCWSPISPVPVSLMPSLALLLHLADGGDGVGDVSLKQAQRAAALGKKLKDECSSSIELYHRARRSTCNRLQAGLDAD